MPRRKTFLSEFEGNSVWTWCTNEEVGHTQEAKKEVLALLPQGTVFDTPKPTRLLRRILETTTDKDAAESVNLKPDTVYHWKSRDGAPIEEALQLMIADGLVVAHHVRRRNIAKAMMVKVAGLDSEDERLRQNVSTEIIEWEMGKASQRTVVEGTGKDGAVVFQFTGNIPEDGF